METQKDAAAFPAETSWPRGRLFTPRISAGFLIRLALISGKRAKCMSAWQMAHSGYMGDGFISPDNLSNRGSALRMAAPGFNTTLWMANTCRRKLRQISGIILPPWSSTRKRSGCFQSSHRDCRGIAITTLITPESACRYAVPARSPLRLFLLFAFRGRRDESVETEIHGRRSVVVRPAAG